MPKSGRNRDPLAVEFGYRVLLRRTELRWSRAQLGERIGVTARRIGGVENGDNVPSLTTVVALRDALNVEWTTLLDGLENMSSP